MNFFPKIAATFRQQGKLAQIIIINVALFLTVNISIHILRLPVLDYMVLPIGGYSFIYKIWTIFTYMFTHESLGHIFFNMLLFYFSAQLFHLILGEKKLIYVYVMSGLFGGAFLLICGLLFPGSFSHSYLLGASAAVMGVVMVMAIYAPNYNVSLWGLINMPYKYFAALTFVLSTVLDFSLNTGGKISHIGGALFGLTYGYFLKKGIDMFDIRFLTRKKKKLRVVSYNKTVEDVFNERRVNSELRMNELLDKISKSGYDSLTKKEKDELFNLSQKK
ncbi:MAG: rhomboid family intramembrane serine protease [Bacteroidetes bacterium]|nr:rhomboid family intramembrane serine protease [Bacteroidota bacterium]